MSRSRENPIEVEAVLRGRSLSYLRRRPKAIYSGTLGAFLAVGLPARPRALRFAKHQKHKQSCIKFNDRLFKCNLDLEYR